MLKKLIDIIRNFYKTLTFKEKFTVIFPSILMGLSFFIFKKYIPNNYIPEYVYSINDSTLNIMSLLVAFGLGVVTLLYSSSIFIKIFLFNTSSLWFILLEIVLLTHTILVELKVIISMYHLMWRD